MTLKKQSDRRAHTRGRVFNSQFKYFIVRFFYLGNGRHFTFKQTDL